MKKLFAVFLLTGFLQANAQEHNTSKAYEWPKDSLVVLKLN